MDYLAFGLLAGSLIVVASFAVRDGAPHLAAIPAGSRLGRFGRADIPVAWGRWCADVGLVLCGAGVAVLVVTGAALLLGLSDTLGTMVVGVATAAAVVASALGAARLTQRLRVESEIERSGERPPVVEPPPRAEARAETGPPPPPVAEPRPPTIDPWDEDLPAWAPGSAGSAPVTRTAELPPAGPARPSALVPPPVGVVSPHTPVATVGGDGAPTDDEIAGGDLRSDPWSFPLAPEDPTAGAPGPTHPSGFSSSLLADIESSEEDGQADGAFRSPLLSALLDPDEPPPPSTDGSDRVIDEVPSPIAAGPRERDDVGGR